jgi:hypothetical protein
MCAQTISDFVRNRVVKKINVRKRVAPINTVTLSRKVSEGAITHPSWVVCLYYTSIQYLSILLLWYKLNIYE